MEEKKSVVVAEKMEVTEAPAQDNGPMAMMMQALGQGADIEQITKMMDLQDRWEEAQAKKAYIKAMARFKSVPIVIKKDLFNKQFKSWYASIGSLLSGALPRMGECGLAHRWDIDQSAPPLIKITCIVTHEDGHSESTFMVSPPDKSGSKNPIQEIKSTRTYLQAATFESIMGLAATDANVDDDGNNAKPAKLVDEKQISQLVDCMNEAGVVHADFLKFYAGIAKCDILTVEQMPATMFSPAMTDLKRILEEKNK